MRYEKCQIFQVIILNENDRFKFYAFANEPEQCNETSFLTYVSLSDVVVRTFTQNIRKTWKTFTNP